MKKQRVLLIIPAYNEEANIQRVVRTIEAFQAQPRSYELDYIVINDGSVDATKQICEENHMRAIHLLQNLGIGGAVQTGYLYAYQKQYDIAVQFDGDGQHDIQSLDALLAPILEGKAAFVIGSRFVDGTSSFRSTFLRRCGIRYLSTIIRMCTHCRVTDATSGFRAANQEVIAYLAEQYPADYPEPESIVALSRAGFHLTEVQVNMFERGGGTSSITPLKSIYYMIKVSLAILCVSFEKSGVKNV